MASTIHHLCQSIRGPLTNWKAADWKSAMSWMKKDDGHKFASAGDLKEAFLDELAKGHEVIPIGECDNFDFKTGCKGHEVKEGAE